MRANLNGSTVGLRLANCASRMAFSRSLRFSTRQKCTTELEIEDSVQPENSLQSSGSEPGATGSHFLLIFTSAFHSPGWFKSEISSGQRVQVPAPRGTWMSASASTRDDFPVD